MNQGKRREEERGRGGKGREKENLNYFPQRLKLWGKGKCALSFWVLEGAWLIHEPSRVGLPDLTHPPHLPLSLLLMGLWQGPQEDMGVRVGPGLGWQGRAHLERSALKAGRAWQGLVSCDGSKEMEKEVGGGESRRDTCTPIPQAAGNKQCFEILREPLNQRLSELKGTP